MDITALCTVFAVLRVLPNRSHFFQYETVTVSCGQQGEWRVKRNISKNINQDCFTSRNGTNESLCSIDDLYPSDSGVYWCESAEGECRDAVNITVTSGSVILESPVFPVMEGDDVTLRCINRTPSASNLTDFYKDGFLIRSSSTGNMTIHSVSKSDEGLYKCNISGVGQSPDSWLTVRAGRHAGPPSPVTYILPVMVIVCLSLLFLLVLLLLCLWRSHKDKVDSDVSYTDVIITQEVKPNRIRDIDAAPTLYSTVKPENT